MVTKTDQPSPAASIGLGNKAGKRICTFRGKLAGISNEHSFCPLGGTERRAACEINPATIPTGSVAVDQGNLSEDRIEGTGYHLNNSSSPFAPQRVPLVEKKRKQIDHRLLQVVPFRKGEKKVKEGIEARIVPLR